jgi:hypothetical protein
MKLQEMNLEQELKRLAEYERAWQEYGTDAAIILLCQQTDIVEALKQLQK